MTLTAEIANSPNPAAHEAPALKGVPLLADEPWLTKDSQGYVYWRGHHVEHYSFDRTPEGRTLEQAEARELARRCKDLEAAGFPVNARTALNEDCYEAPADTPWKRVLPYYYSFFRKPGSAQLIGIFTRPSNSKKPGTTFTIEANGNTVFVSEVEGAYEAFKSFDRAGLESEPVSCSYAQTRSMLERLGVAPARLEQELAGEDFA